MRLIDADALKASYIVTTTTTNSICHLYVSQEDINNAPTIDAVEVVRCKDCKYGITHGITDGFVFCSKPYTERGNAMHRTDWFCADGEVNA